ncbi:MAG: M1 family metallopeptidase [Edaphocola sp.]
MNRYCICPLLIAVFFTPACKTLKKNNANDTVHLPEVAVSAHSTLDVYRAVPDKQWWLVHTAINISFDVAQRAAAAKATLVLHPYFYPADSLWLDAKDMEIYSVESNGQPLSYRYNDSAKLLVRLPRTYSRKDTLLLDIGYKAMPYKKLAGGSSAIAEDRGLYFVNADAKEPYQPLQIWTQGETESNSHWFPTFDNPSYRSKFTISIQVADSLKTLSNGLLASSVKGKNGMRTDTWQQKLPIPPYLAMMAIGNFSVAKDVWNGKEVSYYVPQEYGRYARDIFGNTPEMLGYFSGLLGVTFPWDKYAQVVCYDYVSGAMENVSASLFGAFNLKDERQMLDDNNDYIVAHELFHQWFGDYVTAESWSNLTLNESFADYGEHLWAAHQYGEDARQDRWFSGLGRYLGQAQTNDPPLARYHYFDKEDMFDRVTYSKGGLILHYLRGLAGDEAFFASLNKYLRQNALGAAEVAQLRLAFEAVTGKDWHWYFDQWYNKGGHPVLDIVQQTDSAKRQVHVIVHQVQPDSVGLYTLPVKALALYGNSLDTVSVTIAHLADTFSFAWKGNDAPQVIMDGLGWVPGKINSRRSVSDWAKVYHLTPDYLNKRIAIEALADKQTNDTARNAILEAMNSPVPLLQTLAISLYDYQKFNSDNVKNTLSLIAKNNQENKVKEAALKALAPMALKENIGLYQDLVGHNSYRVASAALAALNKTNHNLAEATARALRPDTMQGNMLLFEAAEVMARDGKESDMAFFKNKTLHLYERNRSAIYSAWEEYLDALPAGNTFNDGVAFLSTLANNNPNAMAGFSPASTIFEVYKNAHRKVGAVTSKELVDNWKAKRDTALAAWQQYRGKATNDKIKMLAEKLEKENGDK